MRWNLAKSLLPESNSQTTLTIKAIVDSGAVLFDKYPIWKEEHRAELNQKIVDHYYMSQIGFETFGRFKHELNTRLREIMPYYIELWKTTQFEYNPIENYSMTEGSEEDATSSGSSKLNNTERVSDTPQSSVSNLDKYMSSASQTDTNGSSEGKTKNTRTAWRKGNIGVTTSQQMIEQERNLIINIDQMIIEELQDLFLGVY